MRRCSILHSIELVSTLLILMVKNIPQTNIIITFSSIPVLFLVYQPYIFSFTQDITHLSSTRKLWNNTLLRRSKSYFYNIYKLKIHFVSFHLSPLDLYKNSIKTFLCNQHRFKIKFVTIIIIILS